MIVGICGGLLLGWPASLAWGATGSGARAAQSPWSWDLTAGFDSYLHNYALATTDTTETLSELFFQAGFEGRSAATATHRWRLRAEAGAGTELFRERLFAERRWLGQDRIERARVTGSFWGRQYRETTDYTRSSDNWEGQLEGRLSPLVGRVARLELRGWAGRLDYRTPSTLEVAHNDAGAGVFVRSVALGRTIWGLGVRGGQRTYPDSTAIDRDTWSLEGDYDHQGEQGSGLRVYQKSERRLVRDQSVRPSAWTHWTDFAGSLGAGPGQVRLDLQAESWQYDYETDVYFNSTRLDGSLAYRWGDILAATWQVGLAGEHLAAGDSPETYSQLGLRGGVESYGSEVSGSLTVEYGRRVYAQGAVSLDPLGTDPALLDTVLLYSDFNYWKIWLLGSWHLSRTWDVDLMANYEPESHTEQSDDSALGFASLRLRWRP